jgi:hypothetical protein
VSAYAYLPCRSLAYRLGEDSPVDFDQLDQALNDLDDLTVDL